jgi:hypothetical protein
MTDFIPQKHLKLQRGDLKKSSRSKLLDEIFVDDLREEIRHAARFAELVILQTSYQILVLKSIHGKRQILPITPPHP